MSKPSGLIAKKIATKGKKGTVYRTYWVKPEGGDDSPLSRLAAMRKGGEFSEGSATPPAAAKEYTGKRLNWQKLAQLKHNPKALSEYAGTVSPAMEQSVEKGKAWGKKALEGKEGQELMDTASRILDSSMRKYQKVGASTHDIAFWSGVGSEVEPVYHETRAKLDKVATEKMKQQHEEYMRVKAKKEEEEQAANVAEFRAWKAARLAKKAQEEREG